MKADHSSDTASATTGHLGKRPEERPSLLDRFRRWLNYEDENERRRTERRAVPGLTAYYWTGGAPHPYKLGNISLTGMYLLTEERWGVETVVQMTLQKIDERNEGAPQMVTVLVKVVRWGEDGLGLEFIFCDFLDHRGVAALPGTNMEALLHFMRGLNLPGNGTL